MVRIEWNTRALEVQILRKVPEIDNPSIREVIFQNYRIIYRNMTNFVEIGVRFAVVGWYLQINIRGI